MKHEHFWIMCAAAGATIVVLGGAATAALADPRIPVTTVTAPRLDEEGRTTTVSYRDLNLASVHDEKVLNHRVGRAVNFVCDTNLGHADSVDFACANYAWRGARPQIAQAVRRAREIAQVGTSSIPLVAIAISVR